MPPTPFCPECGNVLSAGAAACPHCGFRIQAGAAPPPAEGPRRSWNREAAILVGILLATFALGTLGQWVTARPHATPSGREEIVEFQEDSRPSVAPAPPADGTYEISAIDIPATLVNPEQVGWEIARAYPSLLRDAGITGRATVRMRVRADGTVDPDGIEILDSTHELFGEAAARVAPSMRFTPAQWDGHPVAVWVVQAVDFQLEDSTRVPGR